MKPEKVYACYSKDKDVRLSSSSGAVFSSLAEYVLNKNGIVYGVAMSEDCYSAEFIAVKDRGRLIKLRGSKYLQAKVGDTFKAVRADLQSGKMVLFTGTGCQVNGLKNFLGKDYDNLICMDVICHGVPSPALWREYAQYQEKKFSGKLKSINFRCKDEKWDNLGMKEVLADIPEDSVRKLYISKDKDPYMQMFLSDYCLRPSCYKCAAKREKQSDITIGDFWGIELVDEGMSDGLGTSIVILRTIKGDTLFDKIIDKMKIQKVSYDAAVRWNPAEYKSCEKPLCRDFYFKDMSSIGFDELQTKYIKINDVPLKEKIKYDIKNVIKKILHIKTITSNVNYGVLFVFCVWEEKG